MDLRKLLVILDKLAPLNLAAKWDNVGLLAEPSSPLLVKKIMLTNDLTELVLKEAIDWKANMVISYHPPIFNSLKRLTNDKWKERLIIQAIENRIAIYSPHTACDAVRGGVNDWLSACLGEVSKSEPIEQSYHPHSCKLLKTFKDKDSTTDDVPKNLYEATSFKSKMEYEGTHNTEILCPQDEINDVFLDLTEDLQKNSTIINLDPKPIKGTGFGRICHLKTPTSLIDLVNKVKNYLRLPKLRLAVGENCNVDNLIKTVALCAGSGASILRGTRADVFLTGEMSHHDILDAVSNQTSVILCEHSNTERGFLFRFKRMLLKEINSEGIEVEVSESDKDPVTIC